MEFRSEIITERNLKMNSNLSLFSSNELSFAQNLQLQISQKEFEIKLVDINRQYSTPLNSGDYYYNQQRKMLIEMEISNLKIQRDGHLNNSLNYALELAEFEIANKNNFSSAAIVLSNVYSFISINNIRFVLNTFVISKIYSISFSLLQNPLEYSLLRTEINKLKLYFHIP